MGSQVNSSVVGGEATAPAFRTVAMHSATAPDIASVGATRSSSSAAEPSCVEGKSGVVEDATSGGTTIGAGVAGTEGVTAGAGATTVGGATTGAGAAATAAATCTHSVAPPMYLCA